MAGDRRWRLVLFTALSGCGWLLDTSIMSWLVHHKVSPTLANIVSASTALLVVFVLSRRRIFARQGDNLWMSLLAYTLFNAASVLIASLAINTVTDALTLVATGLWIRLILDGIGVADVTTVAAVCAKIAVTPLTLYSNFRFTAWLLSRKAMVS